MARPYPRRQSSTWFLARPAYLIFLLRELSAVFVALYAVALLLLVRAVLDGPATFESYVSTLRSPPFVAFHVVALLFALLHSVTWFQAVPKGLPLRRGEEKVPPPLLIGANYLAMAGASAIVLAIALL